LKSGYTPFNGVMAAHAAEVHVLPHATTGGWTLDAADAMPAWFATLSEAEQAARRQAVSSDAAIFLHDRYHRVRALVQR
jgi:hypothetical protein